MAPDYVIDDGADLIASLHTNRKDVLKNVKGANEETTTGVLRVRAMEKEGKLKFPVMAVNDAKMKYLFDNRYGTGQSTFEGWMVATNLIVAGKNVVVGGYGWCGKGVAMRAKGLGAIVTVTEVDPIKAIEAVMDGFHVKKMVEAVKTADIVLTVTGCNDILSEKDFKVMKSGCVMGNVGHFDNEINIEDLKRLSKSRQRVREHIMEYVMEDGRRLYAISDGRLMNLAAGQGHPAEIMDMSFAVQALSIEYLVKNHEKMENKVYSVPHKIDKLIAETKLKSMGIKTDKLTDSQIHYLGGWETGTQ
jgi:adenosylhomocysteinase